MSPRRGFRAGEAAGRPSWWGRSYGWSDDLDAGLRTAASTFTCMPGPGSVGPEGWVQVLSRYGPGWLHPVRAANGGDSRAATWEDLNLPAPHADPAGRRPSPDRAPQC